MRDGRIPFELGRRGFLRWSTAAGAGALAGLGVGCSSGIGERPISIICPWAEGGGTDTVSRITADGLKDVLGRRVNVVNRKGGAGVTGHSAGAKAAPDGNTLTMITAELCMMHWRGLTDIDPDDFAPIMLMNKVPGSIVVRNDAPWQTMEELQEAIRENPKTLTASGTAKGGIWHLACCGWLVASGFGPDDLIWVPSTGAAPALQQLISGGYDVVFCGAGEAQTLIESGEVRPLVVMSPERDPFFPDVPSCKEQGVDFEIVGWCGLAAPKGTSQETIQELEAALKEVAASEQFKTFMNNTGFRVDVEDSQWFTAFLREDDVKYGRLLKAAGIIE